MGDENFQRIEGNFANVNGLKMYYEEYGTGYPLLLIHGGISSIQMWEKQLSDFSQHFRVIAVDCRGQGKTNNPEGVFHYKLMADDFAAFIQELNLEKVLLCGWSDGGQIGLEMGLHYPGLVKAMVLGGTMIHATKEMLAGFKEIGIEGPGTVDFEKLDKSLGWLVKLLKEQTASQGKDYWKTLLNKISKMWYDPAEFPLDQVKQIQTPSLILLGDRDVYIPISEATKMYKLIPNAELAIIPNSNHDVYFTQPEIYNRIVVNYCKRQTDKKNK